jgi:hypothetical protein
MLTPKERALAAEIKQAVFDVEEDRDYWKWQAHEARAAVEEAELAGYTRALAEFNVECVSIGLKQGLEEAAKIVESSIIRHGDWVECTLTPEQLAAKIRSQANELVSTTDGSELLRLADNLAKAVKGIEGVDIGTHHWWAVEKQLFDALAAYERLREGK